MVKPASGSTAGTLFLCKARLLYRFRGKLISTLLEHIHLSGTGPECIKVSRNSSTAMIAWSPAKEGKELEAEKEKSHVPYLVLPACGRL